MSIIFESSDQWQISRLEKGYLISLTQTATRFTGHYLDLENSSTFSGEIFHGRGHTLVQLVQSTPSSDYYAVHSGKLIRSDYIEGYWYDTAGNAGYFSMKRLADLAGAIDNARERAIASRFPRNVDPIIPPPTAGVRPVSD